MNPIAIIEKYYAPNSQMHRMLVTHSRHVAEKALAIAARVPELKPNEQFIAEAAMLHDIGILFVDAPHTGCYGSKPYLAHGYLGRELLEKEGFPKHALVAERHIGVGITKDEIIAHELPIPPRDMVPTTIDEEIISFADLFYSKSPKNLDTEKTVAEVEAELQRFGDEKVAIFRRWCEKFKEIPNN